MEIPASTDHGLALFFSSLGCGLKLRYLGNLCKVEVVSGSYAECIISFSHPLVQTTLFPSLA